MVHRFLHLTPYKIIRFLLFDHAQLAIFLNFNFFNLVKTFLLIVSRTDSNKSSLLIETCRMFFLFIWPSL